MRRAGLTVLLVLISSVASGEVTIQEVLLRAKPGVALVVSEVAAEVTLMCATEPVKVKPPPFRETGTGWFVSPSGWLITNAHVVASAYRPPDALRTQFGNQTARPGCRVAEVKLIPSINVILSNGFHLPATVAKYSPPVADEAMSGQDLALLRLEAADLPSLALGDSATLKIGDRLHIIGYPGVVLTHELLSASAKVEASITNGAVSGFRQDRAGQPIIQTDAPAAWGNSGGPAINDRGEVVGVLTFVSPAVAEDAFVQGFNFVIPGGAVREFLKGTAARLDEPSRFNEAWHAALRDFFTGRHRQAEPALVEANRLMPELTDVKRVMVENAEKITNPPPVPFPWMALGAGAAGLALAASGVLWGLRRRRNRFRIKPSEVARLLEGSSPPAILDVREAAAYEKSPVRIPRARHVSPQDLVAGARLEIELERTLVAYCT